MQISPNILIKSKNTFTLRSLNLFVLEKMYWELPAKFLKGKQEKSKNVEKNVLRVTAAPNGMFFYLFVCFFPSLPRIKLLNKFTTVKHPKDPTKVYLNKKINSEYMISRNTCILP